MTHFVKYILSSGVDSRDNVTKNKNLRKKKLNKKYNFKIIINNYKLL